jgi:hypothetical protein
MPVGAAPSRRSKPGLQQQTQSTQEFKAQTWQPSAHPHPLPTNVYQTSPIQFDHVALLTTDSSQQQIGQSRLFAVYTHAKQANQSPSGD